MEKPPLRILRQVLADDNMCRRQFGDWALESHRIIELRREPQDERRAERRPPERWIEGTFRWARTMTMGPSAMIYDHESATCSGNFSRRHTGQPDVPTVHVAGCTLAVEENGDAVFAQTPIGVAGEHEATFATGNFSDVPSPTATVTGSGALLVKNPVVHFSLSP